MKIKLANWLKIGVSLIVLVAVIAGVGAENLLAALRGIDLRWFALALAIHLAGVVIRAYRWWLLIASLGTPVAFGRLLYLYFAGAFFNTFLPTGIGGDVVKIVELTPERGGARAFSTVFVDRLTGLLGSSLIALAVALIDPADVPPDVRAAVVIVSAGILFATFLLTQGKLVDQLIWRSRRLSNLPLVGRIHRIYVALTSYSLGALARSTLVSLPFTVTLIATQYVLSIALGLRIDARYFMLFTPIVALTQALPLSLNGLGIREGAFQVLFASIGVAAPDAVAMSLLYQIVRLLAGLLGGALYIVGNLRGQDMLRSIFYFFKVRLLGLVIFKRHTQVYIISYPKSGRTWLKVLIGKAICLKYGLPDELMLDTHRLTAAAGLPPAHFSHDFSEILSELPYDRLPANKAGYADKKVIFITRDVKDVLVSSYFQATKRTNKFRGPISEFVRSEKFGARKVIAFYNIWHANRRLPKEFLLVRYEDMHQHPGETLAHTLRCMGVADIDDRTIQEAIAFARFDNMQRMESAGYFNDPRMRPGDASDAESYKVRKGVVGGYAVYLSDADIQYIDDTIAEMGCPFVGVSPQAGREVSLLTRIGRDSSPLRDSE